MKKLYFIILSFGALLLTACKDDIAKTGSSLLNFDDDGIVVKVDTFRLTSTLQQDEKIISMPDSFLVGELVNDYMDLKADLLAQFACPVGYKYPENAELDSVCFVFYYTSYIGDGNAPLSIQAYEMDKTFQYNQTYYSNINVDQYCSPAMRETELLVDPYVIFPARRIDSVYNGSKYVSAVFYKMSDDFAKKFFNIRDFSSQEAFQKKFKGLYITPTFGSSNILHISTMAISVYYHVNRSYIDPNGKTHNDTINDMKAFYANSEVRQVNRFDYLNKRHLLSVMESESDSVNFIIGPGGVMTVLHIPLLEMKYKIEANLRGKRPYVNKAQLKVKVAYEIGKADSKKNRNDWAKPAPYMLLLRDTLHDDNRFFRNKSILNTANDAILSELLTGKKKDGTSYYYYSFDLSELLTYKLRSDSKNEQPDTLHMHMVPVEVELSSSGSSTSTSTSITAIRQAQSISNTFILSPSPSNDAEPLDLEVVYSGF